MFAFARRGHREYIMRATARVAGMETLESDAHIITLFLLFLGANYRRGSDDAKHHSRPAARRARVVVTGAPEM